MTYQWHGGLQFTLLHLPCRKDGWLDVTLHYTGGRQKQRPSEDEEELALAKRFSGDSVDELTHVRCFRQSQSPVKAATASPDGSLLRRCSLTHSDRLHHSLRCHEGCCLCVRIHDINQSVSSTSCHSCITLLCLTSISQALQCSISFHTCCSSFRSESHPAC